MSIMQRSCYMRLQDIIKEERNLIHAVREAGVQMVRQPQLEGDPTVFCMKCSREVR